MNILIFLLQYFAKLLPQLEADYWVPAGSGFGEFFEKLNKNAYGFFSPEINLSSTRNSVTYSFSGKLKCFHIPYFNYYLFTS